MTNSQLHGDVRRQSRLTIAVVVTLSCFLLAQGTVHAEPKAAEIDTLLSAPTHLVVNGRTLELDSYVYLNLMPKVIEPGRSVNCQEAGPLIATVSLIGRGIGGTPESITVDHVWIRSGDSWWDGEFSEKETRVDGNRLIKIARGCPSNVWSPGFAVDVIIRVINEAGETLFLRVPTRLGAAH